MKEPLKVGDRVAVYDHGHRLVGKMAVLASSDNIIVVGSGMEAGLLVHYKQCRRLKPKRERRRVWVDFDFKTNEPFAVATTCEGLRYKWMMREDGRVRYSREFIEVRK